MAVSWPLASAVSWFQNVFINAAVMQTNVTDPLNDLNTRTAMVGPISSGIFTAATGVTIGSQVGYIIGNQAWVRINYTVGASFPGVPITPPSSGDISNVVIATITDTRFQTTASFADQSLTTSAVGRLAAHAVRTSTDDIVLTAVSGTANIANGDAFTAAGAYLLS